ncbi:MAG: exonuclease domain-containing protein [Algoriphagus sp.]|jgi:DNA polymerase-3 subunit epsilon|nr:exonuclease domain-containing protein [Algoriphagus sp.]
MEFAIVDIETTGGNPKGGGITEIAVVIHDGRRIIHEYQTLINPRMAVPSYITGLTGIDSSMLWDAPFFETISEELWELLEGRVFVAHQVNFDFSFIREAFLKVGKELDSPKLCTVRLSRKIFPGLGSYSLGRICEQQKIPILARHRAMGDAKATALLFDRMIQEKPEIIQASLKKNTGDSFLPPLFPSSKFRQLPESCGVYYMLNDKGKVIYVGKANNIKERFKGHFSGNVLPQLKQQLKSEVVDVHWQLTGSEFMALLIETLEIKRLWPKYNSAMKLPKTLWGLFHYQDGSGFYRFQISKVSKNLKPLETFFSSEEARHFLMEAVEVYQLCQKFCGLRAVTCAVVQDTSCQGACSSGENPADYNHRVEECINRIKGAKKELLITLPGRKEGEKAACLFQGGILAKYGFLEKEFIVSEDLEMVPLIPETYYLLRQFIHRIPEDQIQVLEPSPISSPIQLGFF